MVRAVQPAGTKATPPVSSSGGRMNKKQATKLVVAVLDTVATLVAEKRMRSLEARVAYLEARSHSHAGVGL